MLADSRTNEAVRRPDRFRSARWGRHVLPGAHRRPGLGDSGEPRSHPCPLRAAPGGHLQAVPASRGPALASPVRQRLRARTDGLDRPTRILPLCSWWRASTHWSSIRSSRVEPTLPSSPNARPRPSCAPQRLPPELRGGQDPNTCGNLPRRVLLTPATSRRPHPVENYARARD